MTAAIPSTAKKPVVNHGKDRARPKESKRVSHHLTANAAAIANRLVRSNGSLRSLRGVRMTGAPGDGKQLQVGKAHATTSAGHDRS